MKNFQITEDEYGDYFYGTGTTTPGIRCRVDEVGQGGTQAPNLTTFIRASRLVLAPISTPPAAALRKQLAAFKAALTPPQLADLWYPWREPIESALADASGGNATALSAAKAMVRALPWVDGRDDAIRAAALAIVRAE